MYTETEGIILKQIKTIGGRRMIVLLSEKYGKISAGTSISEKGKNKTALALRPFTKGRYELFKNKETYNINGAETIESFFSLGEDVDKYMIASYALELTDLMLEEGQSAKGMYNLIVEFLGLLEKRKNSYDTLLVAFMLKALKLSGSAPVLEGCVKCGCKDNLKAFSVPDGGLICENCYDAPARLNPLIFEVSNDIINVTVFIENHPLRSLENLALPKESEVLLKRILKAYFAFHLGIENLKSEGLKI